MQTIRISLAVLALTVCTALAVPPTGTVYRVVMTDTNGVLVGSSTNLAPANGLAGTGSVAAAAQTAASGLATGITAQAAATLAMATGQTAQAKADLAMQEAQRGPTNVTGLLTWTGRLIGLTASAVSNAMAGVYALVEHLHSSDAITNAPWAAQADYVATSNKAAGALQAEEDTINTVLQRGSTITLGVESGIKISPLTDWLGSRSLVFLCPSNFPTTDHAVPLHLYAQYYPYYPIGPSLFHGAVLTDVGGPGTEYMLYDSGNFLAGTHYLAPNGSGTSLTGLTPAQIGAAWRTNQVLGIDGTTNTIIYLGVP